MENIDDIIDQLRNSIACNDIRLIEEVIDTVSENNYENIDIDMTPFPPKLFETICELMERPDFQQMPDAFKILFLFESEWSRLSEKQRIFLAKPLIHNFSKFKDEMACHVISELFGRFYCNQQGYEALCELKKTDCTLARDTVPMGFSYIASLSLFPEVRAQAYVQLVEMRTDMAASVRQAVEYELAKMSRMNETEEGK